MKASETSLVGLIQGQKQFQIPLYQRTYSWQDKHLSRLWDDIVNQIELLTAGAAGPSHFLARLCLHLHRTLRHPSSDGWLLMISNG